MSQLAVDLVHPQTLGHMVGHLGPVAGEHDGLFHADALQGSDGIPSMRLLHIGDHNVTGVLAVQGPVLLQTWVIPPLS